MNSTVEAKLSYLFLPPVNLLSVKTRPVSAITSILQGYFWSHTNFCSISCYFVCMCVCVHMDTSVPVGADVCAGHPWVSFLRCRLSLFSSFSFFVCSKVSHWLRNSPNTLAGVSQWTPGNLSLLPSTGLWTWRVMLGFFSVGSKDQTWVPEFIKQMHYWLSHRPALCLGFD